MNPYVKDIKIIDKKNIEILFMNNEKKMFDITPYLEKGVFKKLKNPTIFKAAKVVSGSVEWQGEIDLSYDTLYLESR